MEWTSVKKGWVYQRKKHLFLPTTWSPKYLVLYTAPIPALAIYEQRSDAMPPYAPLLHLELAAGDILVSTVGILGKSGGSGGLFGYLAESMSSRKASIVSALSRRGSFRDLNDRRSHDSSADASISSQNTKTKSYKERMLDEQGFMITRQSASGSVTLKICFATESREERDAWMTEIIRVIDFANRKANPITNPDVFDGGRGVKEEDLEAYVLRQRSASEDLSLSCYGVKILDDRQVKHWLHPGTEDYAEVESIKTSQIIESSNRQSSLIPEDLNLKYQTALIDKRTSGSFDERRRAELKVMKLLGQFNKEVAKVVKKTVDVLHTGRKTLQNGLIHEDSYVRVQFIVDYQNSGDEEQSIARQWIQQELLATQWVNGQDAVQALCTLMTSVEYKGFKAMAVAKLPLCNQKTLQFDLQDDINSPIVSESVLTVMRSLAKELHLLPSYPWRLTDGRTIQMALHPSIQVHQIQSTTLASSASIMIVGKQAGKIQGGGAAIAATISPVGYYLINLAELIPQWQGENFEMIRVIRPELLMRVNGSVGTGSLHPEATTSALSNLIEKSIDELIEDLEELKELPLDSKRWTEVIHERGLNCSLMGLLAERCRLPHVQEGLLIEMIARTLKRAVRSQLQQTVLHFREVQALLVEEELANIAVSTMNALLSPIQDSSNMEWKLSLLKATSNKYGFEKYDLDNLKGLSKIAVFLAVQHHCGFEFTDDSVYSIMNGIPLEPKNFSKFTLDISLPFKPEPAQGDEEEIKARLLTHLVDEKKLTQAALSRDFEDLYRQTGDSVNISLAKNVCPSGHAQISSIMLAELETCPIEKFSLPEAMDTFMKAAQAAKNHLGDHHPFLLVLSERFCKVLQDYDDQTDCLWEALKLRQSIIKESSKILGKSHNMSKSQFKEIGDLQLKLHEYDRAIESYNEALKQKPTTTEKTVEIYKKLGECYRCKEDIESALNQIKTCRKLVEQELPRRSADPNGRASLLRLQEDILELLAVLSQSVYHEDPNQQMISGDMEAYLKTAIECYEKLFDLQKARTESDAEGEKLVQLLQKIIGLKLKLARPASKAVIKLVTKQQEKEQASADDANAKLMHELVVRLLSGPITPSCFMDKLMDQIASPDTMKDAEPELKAGKGCLGPMGKLPVTKSGKQKLKNSQLISKYHAKLNEAKKNDSGLDGNIEELGGFEAYQAASLYGTKHGDTSKWFLKEFKAFRKLGKTYRLLDVGALAHNYAACGSWCQPTAIDLRPLIPGIQKANFLEWQPAEAFDIICLSLVLNFVGDPRERGRMLRRAWDNLNEDGFLFVVLPRSCIDHSRFVTLEYVEGLMVHIGFELMKQHNSRKLSYFLFRKTKNNNGGKQPEEPKLKVGGFNNFKIKL